MNKARTSTKKPELRRYFFDTEFNAKTPDPFQVDFISIGIVDEKGSKEYYGISNEFNKAAADEIPWLKKHVIDKLDPPEKWESIDQIRQQILDMIEPAREVEFWAKNGSYDNVLLCQIFGGMGELRNALQKEKGVQKLTFRDSKELFRQYPNMKLWQRETAGEHIAINDARHERIAVLLTEQAIKMADKAPAPHLPHLKS